MKDNLYLRAFEYSDLSLLNEIRNDDILFQTTGGNKYYISSEYDKKWIEDKIFNNYKQLYLVICCRGIDEPIGYICATNIDYLNRKAEWGGLVISKEFISKGFGTDAGYLFLDHLFGELGLNMVYAYVKEDNKASYRLSEKYGFKKDGLIRDFVYKQNKFHNAYVFTMLKSEYEKLQLHEEEASIR
ncbi:GNAT family N-acetyltransferase [Solibacillus sp. MA9]|uniref:GNAT family N-acetyltransferase n=1 Tax=Solibacillus palustris TaxID=2908203 RepID=A0ABS9UA53_9BACL|nr:GNAT family protein [Solibacillus sp. MA9]MCH7321030.1 GNAT family N-acetyltransferase [Solibacillus sp. MA9]